MAFDFALVRCAAGRFSENANPCNRPHAKRGTMLRAASSGSASKAMDTPDFAEASAGKRPAGTSSGDK
jgi:hypothetical protein